MKKNTIIAILCLISNLITTNVLAQAADHSFNYQGELLDGGAPANGLYDILVQMVDGQGTNIGTASVHDNTQVDNGLFNIDVEIGGISSFDGYEDYYFEISIRPGASGGSYTVISPVQGLQAVPLATNLVNGTATTGQVLTFNGFQWEPQTPGSNSSPWIESGSNVSYAGDALIGTSVNSHRLVVQADTDNLALRLIGNIGTFGTGARLNFGDGQNAYIDEPVDDHLTIHAIDVSIDGDIKQSIDDNGAMKYMVHAYCGNTGSSIVKSYNGIFNGAITITDEIQAGRCEITFPEDISDRYFQVSPIFGSPGRAASCSISLNELNCVRFNPSTLTGANGPIMVLIY